MYDREDDVNAGAEMNTGATLSVICTGTNVNFILESEILNQLFADAEFTFCMHFFPGRRFGTSFIKHPLRCMFRLSYMCSTLIHTYELPSSRSHKKLCVKRAEDELKRLPD